MQHHSRSMLFPDRKRDIQAAPQQMSSYQFISRCSREDCAQIRELLERWFARYPDKKKERLKSELVSGDEYNFRSAFWELYVHELLRALGYSVRVHPDLSTTTSKKPDFLATSQSGQELVVEATTHQKPKEVHGAKKRRSQFLDTIENLDHPDFCLGLEEEGLPAENPSGKQAASSIRARLRDWLDSLDYDRCLNRAKQKSIYSLPEKSFSIVEDWKLTFRAFPKTERRGYDKTIVLHFTGFRSIDPWKSMHKKIRRKASQSKYGEVERPFVVAVNSVGEFAQTHGTSNFGIAQFFAETIEIPVLGSEGESKYDAQSPRCVWVRGDGSKNDFISAVLMGFGITPWRIAADDLALFHSPWPAYTCEGEITKIREFHPKGTDLRIDEGASPHSIFKVPEKWPNTPA